MYALCNWQAGTDCTWGDKAQNPEGCSFTHPSAHVEKNNTILHFLLIFLYMENKLKMHWVVPDPMLAQTTFHNAWMDGNRDPGTSWDGVGGVIAG